MKMYSSFLESVIGDLRLSVNKAEDELTVTTILTDYSNLIRYLNKHEVTEGKKSWMTAEDEYQALWDLARKVPMDLNVPLPESENDVYVEVFIYTFSKICRHLESNFIRSIDKKFMSVAEMYVDNPGAFTVILSSMRNIIVSVAFIDKARSLGCDVPSDTADFVSNALHIFLNRIAEKDIEGAISVVKRVIEIRADITMIPAIQSTKS